MIFLIVVGCESSIPWRWKCFDGQGMFTIKTPDFWCWWKMWNHNEIFNSTHFVEDCKTSSRLKPLMECVHTIKMSLLSVQSRSFCKWQKKFSWYLLTHLALSEYGVDSIAFWLLLWSMQFGYMIAFPTSFLLNPVLGLFTNITFNHYNLLCSHHVLDYSLYVLCFYSKTLRQGEDW